MKNNELLTGGAVMRRKESIDVIAQAFYGNRTATTIDLAQMDAFILGYQDSSLPNTERIDRTIVRIPDTDNLVIIYNKFQEEEVRAKNTKALEEDGYIGKPLASIPEENIEIYSRCIVCRLDSTGEFQSLKSEDYMIVMKYLAQ